MRGGTQRRGDTRRQHTTRHDTTQGVQISLRVRAQHPSLRHAIPVLFKLCSGLRSLTQGRFATNLVGLCAFSHASFLVSQYVHGTCQEGR